MIRGYRIRRTKRKLSMPYLRQVFGKRIENCPAEWDSSRAEVYYFGKGLGNTTVISQRGDSSIIISGSRQGIGRTVSALEEEAGFSLKPIQVIVYS